jgi:hypothetical protein
MVQDPAPPEPLLEFGCPLQDEPMDPVVRLRVRASESMIDDQRERKAIGRLDGCRQGPVLLRPVVHLDPIQDELRPVPLRAVVEPTHALLWDYGVSFAHRSTLIA